MKHDINLKIYTGNSRKEKYWKPLNITWSKLIERLSKAYITEETEISYANLSKTKRDEIKDVGGFVGGKLTGGRRHRDSVETRTLISLDIDYAPVDFADTMQLLFSDFAWCIYSTHSNTVDSPRLRLVIPLQKAIGAEAYEAVARKIAEDVGIQYFDDSTYEANRLMYWPSTPKDSEYIFEVCDAPFLKAAGVLQRYKDWKDIYSWPRSDREIQKHKTLKDKQQDPLEKTGLIGAFCRTYSITDAITKFIPDTYIQCDIEGRYTYAAGSTAAGVVVYDDIFSYSHHGTDPAGGKLCNAFDLIRIHKYGKLDEDITDDILAAKLPSCKALVTFAQNDPEIKLTLGKEKLEEAKEEFGDEVGDIEWIKKLTANRRGEYDPTIDNFLTILRNDPRLKNKIGYNEMTKRPIVFGEMLWKKTDTNWCDVDDANLRHYVEKVYKIHSAAKLYDAVNVEMNKNTFHPVRDYLDSLEWDGVERVDTLLTDYFGAEDSEYTRAVIRKWLTAGVARIYRPGCKFDYMLVLVGAQGIGKSTLAATLGKEWYSDSFDTVKGKEAYEQIQGVWIAEMAEMSAIKKAEVETIKHFVSKQEDNFRAAYGRRKENHKRQCLFMGNSNTAGFLQDETGNRRFWIIQCGITKPEKNLFEGLISYEVDQLWAEAKHKFKQGEKLYLNQELDKAAQKIQKKHLQIPEYVGSIQSYLDVKLPDNWKNRSLESRKLFFRGDFEEGEGIVTRDRTCAIEVWEELLGGTKANYTQIKGREINKALIYLGWEKCSTIQFDHYGIQRGFKKSTNTFTKNI